MASKKTSQVSTTIPTPLFKALDDHRWTVRLKMTDLYRVALVEYAKNHDVEWTDEDTDEEDSQNESKSE